MNKIVLASSSPRRIEILTKFGLNPTVLKAEIEEKISNGEKPEIVVMGLALEKALSVSKDLEKDRIIIAADTIVVLDNKILGKPSDEEEAYNMLHSLSGKEHKVITGLSIIKVQSNIKIVDYETTYVKFRDLSKEKINNYIKTKEPMDKAGAYGIQGLGEILVEEIKGSYSNVVGLPIGKLDFLLSKFFGIKII